jgi:hypothetical protein
MSSVSVSSRTMKSVAMMARSVLKLMQILKSTQPTFTPNLCSCLTVMVENLHAVSHLKHGLPTKLEYARDFGRIHHESVKRMVKWAAYYFTHAGSYYPVPESSLSLCDIPKLTKPEGRKATKEDLMALHDWARLHGKCVRQRTVRQDNTKYRAGTLPLNMYSSKATEGTALAFPNAVGNTVVQEGAGNTVVPGGAGNTVVPGGAGNTVVQEAAGNTVVPGGAGNTVVPGGAGNTVVPGGTGNTIVPGGAGEKTLATVSKPPANDDSDEYDSEVSEVEDEDANSGAETDNPCRRRTERSETDFLLGRTMTRSGRTITISSRMVNSYM